MKYRKQFYIQNVSQIRIEKKHYKHKVSTLDIHYRKMNLFNIPKHRKSQK